VSARLTGGRGVQIQVPWQRILDRVPGVEIALRPLAEQMREIPIGLEVIGFGRFD
jgi:hypothetical protein